MTMPLTLVGFSFRTTPFDLLERLTPPAVDRGAFLHALLRDGPAHEALLLATCNRVELHTAGGSSEETAAAVCAALAAPGGIDPEHVRAHAQVHTGEEAVRHLFHVAAGLDSLVLGEAEILTQVRASFAHARAERVVGPRLSTLFQHAINAARRVHTDPGLGARSTLSVGLDLVRPRIGGLDGRRALIVGAGKIGRLAARALRDGGADLTVANRTPERADDLAARLGGRAVPLHRLAAELATADLLIASTAASTPTVDAPTVIAALTGRGGRPLTILDLGVPRDVAPSVRDLPGVDLVDLEAIRTEVERAGTAPGEAVARARVLVDRAAAEHLDWERAARLGPTIHALRAHAERLRREELDRARSRLASLTERQAAAVDALTRGLVNKLLHDPVVRAKALTAGPDGDRADELLRALYGLDDDPSPAQEGGDAVRPARGTAAGLLRESGA